MELYKEILIGILKNEEVSVSFPNLHLDAEKIINLSSYQALKAIKNILHDDSLADNECFSKIEEIICLFEALGSDGGTRHDFG